MAQELAQRLLSAHVVTSSDLEAALFLSMARGLPVARALVDQGAISEKTLEEELVRLSGLGLRHVAPAQELYARLPVGMCRRLGAVPVRLDPAGFVDVCAMDVSDLHLAAEFAFQLGTPVRLVRATLTAVEEAIRSLELGDAEMSTRTRRRTPAFPHGAPASSTPPPPFEELPIPLVRRAGTLSLSPSPAPTIVDEAMEVEDDSPSLLDGVPSEPPSKARALELITDDRTVSFPSSPPPTGELEEEAPITDSTPLPDWSPPSEAFARTLETALTHRPAPIPEGPTFVELAEKLERSTDRDQVVGHALAAMALVSERSAIFVARKEGFSGWMCSAAFGDVKALKAVSIPHAIPSVFSTAAAAGFYLGPIPLTPGHAPLLDVMGEPHSEVSVTIARVGGKPALLFVVDGIDDTMLATKALTEIARKASLALARIVASR